MKKNLSQCERVYWKQRGKAYRSTLIKLGKLRPDGLSKLEPSGGYIRLRRPSQEELHSRELQERLNEEGWVNGFYIGGDS